MTPVPLCKECEFFSKIPGTNKHGICNKNEACPRAVRAYDGQPKKCRKEFNHGNS